ncbi:MAG: lipopolysaccharide biosynthesis protein [Chloroflexota bacterium]|nr:lipopolysaccharide biosynthesis protein [Chloroflexota bacterium]MDQ5865465.1 lipopolysaccharide biosynthesis protein [Chloroflexota bacterium]
MKKDTYLDTDKPTESVGASSGGLGKQAAQGAAWNYLAFVVSKGLVFVSTLILAQILSPAEFGLVGMALLVITVLDILRDFGIGSAVIYYGREGPAAANMAFALSSGIGIVLFAANWLLAPYTAQFFYSENPQDISTVTSLVQVLGLSLLFASLGSTHDALLQKEINYRRRMVPEVGRTLLKGVLSVALAFAGLGVWSLVWGQVLGEVCATVLLWVVTKWRPARLFRRDLLRPMLGYSFQTMLAGGLGTMLADADYFIIGALLGPTALGIYTLAFRIPDLLIRNMAQAVATVAFSVAAKLQSDLAALREAYLKMQRYMLIILAPVGFGLFAVTPTLIHTLFKPDWAPVIPVMQILSVYMVLGGINYWPGVIYKAVGRPDVLNYISLVKLVMLVPALWWGAANYGIEGVAWGQLAVRVVGILIDMVVVARFVKISMWEQLRVIWPPLVAACVMSAAVRLLSFGVDPAERGGIPVLVLSVLVGGAVYAAAIWLLDRSAVGGMLELARSMLKRNRLAPREA